MTRRESYTTVIERNSLWQGAYATEPTEAAWAAEALFFIRSLAATGNDFPPARVQISPDGMHWCDEGGTIALPATPDSVTFCRVREFGGWLRLVGELPPGSEAKVLVYLVLKS